MEKNVATRLEDLNLINRFLFDEVMEDRESYQATVSILLGEDIELMDGPETEKELRVSPELREIRLDVVSMDRSGKLYYTEMQQKDTKNLRRRSRYYQAQLDVSLLAPGSKDFNLLNDSCLILVAPFDIFERGLYRYTFATFCKECPDLKLEDGATRVFINTKGKNKWAFTQEFLDFMEYLTNTTDEVAEKTESYRIKRIHEQVKRIRLSEKMGVKYMQLWEEKAYIREEGLEQGLAEGRDKHLINIICKKLAKAKSLDQIADEVEESLELVEKICLAAQKEAPAYDCNKIYMRLHKGEA
ncbi:MAG: Rpn family recombination-promoting nuclease/putative transposase [Lachnospiraceae bacterium]|nr:Rpn family recombination-promoting nuclease/putative transposase [Lachnospiraceae bacterium]